MDSDNRSLVLTVSILLLAAVLGQAPPTFGQQGTGAAPSDEQVAKILGLSIEQVRKLQSQRGMTNAMLADFPPERVPALLRKLNGGDVARQRGEHAALFLRNDKGIIPDGATLRAIEHQSIMRQKLKPGLRIAGLPSGPNVVPQRLLPRTAGLKPDHTGWDAIGPHHIGGRTRSLLIHPKNPAIMYAGSAGGGVWKSVDSGKNWRPLNDLLAHMAVSCMVMDPTDPDVIFVGTGEGYGDTDANRGGGIFKTENGGDSWGPLPVPLEQKPSFQYVNRLAISPDGKVLLAAVGKADSKEVAADAGIYLCSDPKRTDWRQVWKGHISCVHFDPNDGAKAIAGSLENSPNEGEAYFSVDGGENWTRASPSEFWRGRVELAYARANSSVVYASTRRVNSEIWRSEDGGQIYKKQDAKVNFLIRGWYNNVIWAGDPNNVDLVIVGAVDLWRSVNAGKTLELINDQWAEPASPHADQHAIVGHPFFDGKKNSTVFIGNDGGVYRADDIYTAGSDTKRLRGWAFLSNTYTVTQFHGAAAHAKTGMTLGGAQDNGTHLYHNGKWSKVKGGDGGYCAIDQDDPSYYYGEYFNMQIFRSKVDVLEEGEFLLTGFRQRKLNGMWQGAAWLPGRYHIPDVKNQKTNFIAPFILDPNDSKRLLAGGASLWRTDDARAPVTPDKGPKWDEIKPSDKTDRNFISAIAVADGDSNVIWVGHNNGELFQTQTGKTEKPDWKEVTHKLFPKRICTRIAIDASDHKRAYVTFSGYGPRNVWKTEDNGASWDNISTGLPWAPFRGLAIHPRNPRFLYLGTEVGVFASENGGESWSPTNEGPTNCRVDELFWMGETLVAATHGRGIHRIDLSKAVK